MQVTRSSSTEEFETNLDEQTEPASSPETTFVCASCGGIAGYYPAAYVVVPCPHCEADAYQINERGSRR